MRGIDSTIQSIKKVRAKDVARYALLPGIMPRIKEFADSGFSWLACLMAQIYFSVRLLPADHPYLNPANKGRFGIRHVIAESANRLVLKKENADQIFVFFMLLLGFVLLCLQVFMVLFAYIIKPAFAGGASNFAGMFATPNPENDIAFMMLDSIFAIPGFFNSKFSPTGPGSIPSFNLALQELFQYYNYAILIVGVFIFLYYILIVVGETAQTGVPFGKRFDSIWAPLRLVGAVGLLVPLSFGFNSAQYITLWAAKYGSGFATNAWILFNSSLVQQGNQRNPTGYGDESMIAIPKAPDVQHLVNFMAVTKACQVAYEMASQYEEDKIEIDRYYVHGDEVAADAQAFGADDVLVVFGELDRAKYGSKYAAGVKPWCGQITLHTIVARDNEAPEVAGAAQIQAWYDNIIELLWGQQELEEFGRCAAYVNHITNANSVDPNGLCQDGNLPDTEVKSVLVSNLQAAFDGAVQQGYARTRDSIDYQIPQDLIERGWGGAGIWYNRIAEWNGTLVTAAVNVPTPSNAPEVMEKVEKARKAHDDNVNAADRYSPNLVNFEAIQFDRPYDPGIAKMLDHVYKYWQVNESYTQTDAQVTGNIFFDALNAIFGTAGLFDMRENVNVHPLAQLVALGKGILESSIRNLMTSLAFSFLGGMGSMVDPHLGGALSSISSIFVTLATLGLSIGFTLYYILPFLPFMYFFFAVSNWVKGIFEAMVGVPLWALAHLRMDGNGFAGEQASNGYFLIFEIFVRPILCVFGLLAAIAIFSAMARVLNDVFDIVVVNLTGFDCSDCTNGQATFGQEFKRNVIDEFFYTIVYTILVYMLATSSFKMIDQVPNHILRWMGAGVPSFGDQADDPAAGLQQYVATGGFYLSREIIGAANKGAGLAGQVTGAPLSLLQGRNAAQNIAGTAGPKPGANISTPKNTGGA